MLKSTCFLLVAAFRLLSADILYQNSNQGPTKCRCLPGDACWPTSEQWSSLNASVGGRLIIPHPTAYPCYGGAGFDASDCQQVQLHWDQPHFLYNRSGSMWSFNWEDLGDQRCSLEGAYKFDTVCYTGRVPAYAVDARSVEDIRAALSFVSQHNLRLVVKSTGHDYLGRSTAPGALMIWLHNFQDNTETKASFTPNGCDAGQQFTGPVVTVTAGKTWDDIYLKVAGDFDRKYAVMGGFCYDISAAGGYTLGGGHSLLAPAFGLAVDSVLEMSVVTADGTFLTVNACQNKDLFWALRGGGGGTFGIVTSITYKLHSVPSGLTAYSFLITDLNRTGNLSPAQMEDILEVFVRRTPALENAAWSASYLFSPAQGYGILFLVPADRPNTLGPVEAVRDELVSMQAKSGFLVLAFPNQAGQFIRHYDTFQDWRTWTDTTGLFDGYSHSGFRAILGNRHFPLTALPDSRKTAETIVAGAVKSGFQTGFLCVSSLGDGVRSKDPNQTETSVQPAVRKASWICALFNFWNATTSNAEIAVVKGALNAGLQVWRDAYPDSGSYGNEAFEEEPNWQQAFWGSNYERLLKIKKQADPNGMFVCNRCVGSEEWDESGNCRL